MTSFALRSLILGALAAGTGLLCRYSPEIQGGGGTGIVLKLPATLPGMVAEPREPDAVEKTMLPADTEFAKAIYYSVGGTPATRDVVHCEIVLSGMERRSIHRPEICLPSQGWTITGAATRTIAFPGGRELRVRDLSIRKSFALKDGSRQTLRAHYFYWFVGQDVTTPSHAERIWLTLKDNVTRGVNHRWAYATALAFVTTDLPSGETGERPRSDGATLELLDGFVRNLAPRFQKSFMDNPPVAAAH